MQNNNEEKKHTKKIQRLKIKLPIFYLSLQEEVWISEASTHSEAVDGVAGRHHRVHDVPRAVADGLDRGQVEGGQAGQPGVQSEPNQRAGQTRVSQGRPAGGVDGWKNLFIFVPATSSLNHNHSI